MYILKLDTWQEQDLSDEEVQGESRGAFRLREERSGVEVSCVGGWDPRADSELPLCGQAGFGQRALKIPRGGRVSSK